MALNGNFSSIFTRFRNIAASVLQHATFPHPPLVSPNFPHVPLGGWEYYTAKRGIAIARRLSVCLSVTLVDQDHIGWKSWKVIARTTPLLFLAQRSQYHALRSASRGKRG